VVGPGINGQSRLCLCVHSLNVGISQVTRACQHYWKVVVGKELEGTEHGIVVWGCNREWFQWMAALCKLCQPTPSERIIARFLSVDEPGFGDVVKEGILLRFVLFWTWQAMHNVGISGQTDCS
jgi:hypothetical protein